MLPGDTSSTAQAPQPPSLQDSLTLYNHNKNSINQLHVAGDWCTPISSVHMWIMPPHTVGALWLHLALGVPADVIRRAQV